MAIFCQSCDLIQPSFQITPHFLLSRRKRNFYRTNLTVPVRVILVKLPKLEPPTSWTKIRRFAARSGWRKAASMTSSLFSVLNAFILSSPRALCRARILSNIQLYPGGCVSIFDCMLCFRTFQACPAQPSQTTPASSINPIAESADGRSHWTKRLRQLKVRMLFRARTSP